MPPHLTHVLGKTEINTHSRQGRPEGRAQSLNSFADTLPNITESEPPSSPPVALDGQSARKATLTDLHPAT